MQHGNAAIELGLHIGIAGGREDYLAELVVLLAGCAACKCRGDQASGKQDSSRLHDHRKSPLWPARAMLRELAPLTGTSPSIPLTPDFECCPVVLERRYDADIRIAQGARHL